MRFLLKPSLPSNVANTSQIASAASKAAAASVQAVINTGSACKAWGQQCSPNCGCVLRIEAQLSECASSASPTIVQASYHAKRVMATSHTTCNNDNSHLKPLTTQKASARPILTSCTCPTLHHLAQQAVDHLPGKTLAQMRNEIDMGTLGTRSSVAFRHTVLRENVLPNISSKKKQLGIAKIASMKLGKDESDLDEDNGGVHAMESTKQHGQCYDLVEDSLLSLIHERMPTPRSDTSAESYSPTIGGKFRMYSSSERKQPTDDIEGDRHTEKENELSSIHEASDWQRKSPASFFLYGDESNGNNTGSWFSMTELFIQRMQESISDILLGSGTRTPASTEKVSDEYRPSTTYLQLLDKYGDVRTNSKDEETAMDDWLEYVDHMHSQEDRTTTA